MLDTASIQALETVEIVRTEPPKRLSLDQIRATLTKARTQSHSKRIEEIKLQIADIEAGASMTRLREDSAAKQLKALHNELHEHQAVLDEVRAYAELLKAGGENPEELERSTVLLIGDVKAKIEKCGENTKLVEREKADAARKLSELRTELSNLESGRTLSPTAVAAKDIHRSEMNRARDDSYEKRMSEKLEQCRPEIQRIVASTKQLEAKLMSLPGDANMPARTFFVQDIAAEIRHIQESLHVTLLDQEHELLRNSFQQLCGYSKRFCLFYIDALNMKHIKPRDYASWKDFRDDATRQRIQFFSPSQELPRHMRYGVVRPAPVAESPVPVLAPVQKPIVAAVAEMVEKIATPAPMPPPPTPKAIKPKKAEASKKAIKNKKASDKILTRIVKESKVLKFTEGKRAAILTNGRVMDEPLRDFLEETFGFKRLIWNDGNDNNMIVSLKGKTFDAVFAHPEYTRLINIAKKAEIPVLVLSGKSKQLLCKEICKFYGVELNVELVA